MNGASFTWPNCPDGERSELAVIGTMQYLSELTTQASGSAGGVVASHNQHARYLRARTYPVDPLTLRQAYMRTSFRGLSIRWTDHLTDAQRAGWDTYAANVVMRNALGDPIHLTGRHHFFRSNLAITQGMPGIIPRLNAPTIFNLSSHSPVAYTADAMTQLIRGWFNVADAWNNEFGGFLFVFQSRPQAPTVNFWAGPYCYLGRLAGNLTFPPISPVNLTSNYPLRAGQRLHLACRTVRADARVTHRHRAQCIVTATP